MSTPHDRYESATAVYKTDWYAIDKDAVVKILEMDPDIGLHSTEARHRLACFGSNELVEHGIKSPWLILWEQLTAFLVLVLIVAALLSAALGEWKDTVAILIIVVLNALLGLSQEYRAEKAMAALKRMAVPTVRVRRDGHIAEISAKELVPGDVVLLEAGACVPADGRLIETINLKIQEAPLTGESEPVEKDIHSLAVATALADRHCMAYLGTNVTYGRGTMVVTATGMATEMGRIATLLQTVHREPTPLQIKLDELGRTLTYVAIIIIIVMAVAQLFQGATLKDVFLTSVSMAVAAVPEGLPAVVTISLALGAQRMLRRRVLIRKLTAVETLGSVTTICSDKTGTLTENRMKVVVLQTSEGRVDFERILEKDSKNNLSIAILLAGSTLACDAVLKEDGTNNSIGDPTEGALLVAAAKIGLAKSSLETFLPRVAELPFDSSRKRMTTIHALRAEEAIQAPTSLVTWVTGTGSCIAFTKGAVDGLLTVSTHYWDGASIKPMASENRTFFGAANDGMAADGIRVLGLAFRPLDEMITDFRSLETDLVFVGMIGMIDPVRAETPAAVRVCRDAGIVPIMITGDHPLTARHIARELNIMKEDHILTGPEIDALPDSDFANTIHQISVYARVSPEHKLRIIEQLQDAGEIVAMTGDGVNDAPALKKANIGVAMGITGTDVSKEASDMVLQDDNFATIVAAVEEGRVIYDNIRRFIRYILSTNSGELWIMLCGPFLGMTLPLLPVQILWMNLVTDGLPALALAMEPAERDIMRRPPRQRGEGIIHRAMAIHIIWVGLLMAVVTLSVGFGRWVPGNESSWHTAQTMIFTTVVFLQLGQSLAVRSTRDSLFKQGFLSNPALIGAVLFMIILQMMVIYIPVFQPFFGTKSLTIIEFILCVLAGSMVFWAVEIEKLFLRTMVKRSGERM